MNRQHFFIYKKKCVTAFTSLFNLMYPCLIKLLMSSKKYLTVTKLLNGSVFKYLVN